MMTFRARTLVPFWAFLFLLIGRAAAAPVYNTPVDPNDADSNSDFTGTRVYQDEGASGTATISWEITQSGTLFTYRYTFEMPEAGSLFKDVSHFTLDISDEGFDSDDEDVLRDSLDSNTPDGFDPNDEEYVEFGDNDGLTGAVKFGFGGGKPEEGEINTSDGNLLFYEFTIEQAPVFGNFAVKTGDGTFTNPGLGNELTSMDLDDFLAVPDGFTIPEPSTFALAVTALLPYWLVGRTLRSRRDRPAADLLAQNRRVCRETATG